jgi:hypothetical protein
MKKYLYSKDDLNRVTEIIESNEENNLIYNYYLTCEIEELDYEKIKNGNGYWGIIDNQVIYIDKKEDEIKKENKDSKFSKIINLKTLLSQTDYQVIKCYEAQLLNEPMPYNLQELLAQRKAWREEINALEFQIATLE